MDFDISSKQVPSKLANSFYLKSTKTVARELLGKVLVHQIGKQRYSGIIVETEAYLGLKDPACHTYSGRRTKRNESMYLHGGHAYVYFIYGMHYCFNVVTRTKDEPEAVLIRALQPLENIENPNGPAKLCKAMNFDRASDGTSLLKDKIFIEDWGLKVAPKQIVKAPRIGINYAGEAVHWPLRFYVKNNSWVSKTFTTTRRKKFQAHFGKQSSV